MGGSSRSHHRKTNKLGRQQQQQQDGSHTPPANPDESGEGEGEETDSLSSASSCTSEGGERHVKRRRDDDDDDDGNCDRNRAKKRRPADQASNALEAVSPTKRAAIAPVVDLLSAVAGRVRTAWSRIGVPGLDQEGRWNAFLQQSLSPYIEDFLAVSEAEERNMAAANDELLRDVYYLCERLGEPCKHAGLARVMDVIRDCTSVKHKAAEEVGTEGEEASGAVGEEDLRDLLLMPALTSFFRATEDDETATSHCGKTNASTSGGETAHGEEEAQKDEATRSAAVEAAAKAIKAAIAQLSEKATHQEVQALLQREHRRLDSMADYRLRLLCLLHKQKLLLQRSPAEQAILRAAYAERYLGPAAAILPSGEPHEQASKHAGSHGGESTASEAASVASTTRSYHSALSSLKNSTRLSCPANRVADEKEGSTAVKREPLSRNEEAGRDEPLSLAESTGTVAVAGGKGTATTSSSAAAAAEEELHLFLEASLITDSAELRGTSFCLQPRATAAFPSPSSSAVPTKPHNKEPSHAEGRKEDEEKGQGAAAEADGPPSRATLFDVDTSDVMQYGKRQDLTLRRVHLEAGEVLRLISEQNATMERQTDEEMVYVRELLLLAGSGGGGATSLSSPRLADVETHLRALRSAFDKESAARDKLNEASTAAAVSANPSSPSPSSAASSCRATRATTAPAHSHDLDDGVEQPLHLPSPVRRIFTALSYAPILHYVQTTRHILQSAMWEARLAAVKATTSALVEAYTAYHAKTGDARYAPEKLPSPDRWMAEHATFVVPTPAQAPLHKSKEELGKHMAAADALQRQAERDLCILRERLSIIEKAAPLLADRDAILTQQRELQVGSRERLLSKKVNMAKQLLHEETVRKRMAKELPKILAQLKELQAAWDALVYAPTSTVIPPSQGSATDDDDGGVPELRIGGQSIREVLEQDTEATRAAAPSARGGGVGGAIRTPLYSTTPIVSRPHSRSRSRSVTPPPPPPPPQQQQQRQPSLVGHRSGDSARSRGTAAVAGAASAAPSPSAFPLLSSSNKLPPRAPSSCSSYKNPASLPQSQLSQRSYQARGPSAEAVRSISPAPVNPPRTCHASSFSSTSQPRRLASHRSNGPAKPPDSRTPRVIAGSASRSRTPPVASLSQPARSSPVPARPAMKASTPSLKARNPLTHAAVQRRAETKRAAAVGGVFDRLSPKPKSEASVAGTAAAPHAAQSAASHSGPCGRDGLRARGMSASNVRGNTAFPGPGKYKPHTHLAEEPTANANANANAHTARQSPQRPCVGKAAADRPTMNVDGEIEMSPMCTQAGEQPMHEKEKDGEEERLVATSLSRELNEAV